MLSKDFTVLQLQFSRSLSIVGGDSFLLVFWPIGDSDPLASHTHSEEDFPTLSHWTPCYLPAASTAGEVNGSQWRLREGRPPCSNCQQAIGGAIFPLPRETNITCTKALKYSYLREFIHYSSLGNLHFLFSTMIRRIFLPLLTGEASTAMHM